MKRIYLFSDPECTQQYGQFVTQDWNGEEDLVTAKDSYGVIRADARVENISGITDPVYSTANVGLKDIWGRGPELASVSGSTIPFPLGEVEELHGTDQPTTHYLYVEGGIRLSYQYYHFSETHTTGVLLKCPEYLTGYDEHGDPVYTAAHIWGNTHGVRAWMGYASPSLNSVQPMTFSDDRTNVRLIICEAPILFQGSDYDSSDPINTTQQAFMPVLVADYNGTLTTLNSFFPSALTINVLNYDEYIPDPEGDQTSTGTNVFQDGQGNGLGVSDPAEHIDLATRNTAFAWGGSGVGLTYYKVTPGDLRKIIAEVWGGIFNMSSLINTDTIRNCIIGAFALPIGITGDTATSTVWVGNVPVNCNDTAYFITSSRLVAGTTDPMEPAERFTEDGWGDYNDFLHSTATLYLPFYGSVNVDIHTIARGSISVEIAIDQYNGNIAYWVYTTSMQAPNAEPILYGCYTGNCAVEFPISGFGYSGNLLQKILNTGSSVSDGVGQIGSGVVGIASGNIAGGASSAGGGAMSALSAIRSQIVDVFTKSVTNRGGIVDPMSACISPYDVTLQIRRARPLRPDPTRQIEGVPSATKIHLRDLSGYVKVKECNINTMTCPADEKMEILRMLKEGVYL